MDEPGVAVPAEELLVYERDVFINFRTSRQWVLIKSFALPPDLEDKVVLAMIAQPWNVRSAGGFRKRRAAICCQTCVTLPNMTGVT